MALSMPRKPPTEEPSWRRGGDAAASSTFRGPSRGRGRGGSRPGGRTTGEGVGRDGREGRGSTTTTGGGELPHRADLPAKPPSPSDTKFASAPTGDGTTDNAAAKSRASRRGSRHAPSLNVNPATPMDGSFRGPPSASAAQSPNNSNNNGSRRRRTARSNSKNSARTQTPSPTVSTRSSVLSSSYSGSRASLESSTKPKDLPPHLTAPQQPTVSEPATLEARTDVDTLVEHMRSVAMQRPASPGHTNHIDWAGDEDDELPDLDDWGYGPTNIEHGVGGLAPPKSRDDVISPILEGSLKSLPIIDVGTPANDTPRASAPAVAEETVAVPEVKVGEAEPADKKASAEAIGNNGSVSGSQPLSFEKTKSRRGARSKGRDKGVKADGATKPVAATGPNAAVKEEQTPAKAPSPSQPAFTGPSTRSAGNTLAPTDKPATDAAAPAELTKEKPSPSGLAASIHAPSGLAASIHAPAGLAASIHAPPGLAASIHAPKPSEATPQSAPSHTTAHPVSEAGPGRALPTHTRSQSSRPSPSRLGRDSQSPSRSTNARIHGDGHVRTQSTPATPMTRGGGGAGGAHARTPQTVRPVITVGALSQLARTLGGGPMGAAGRRPEVAAGDK